MAGETGGNGRDLPLRAPLIPFPGWDPGDPRYNENGPFLFIYTYNDIHNKNGGY